MKRLATQEKTLMTEPTKKREIKAEIKNELQPYCGKNAISLMLAQSYDSKVHDPSGWLMSEKLDGVRCYWNGEILYSRNGVKVRAPKEWTNQLPKIALDGELWSKRDDFHNICTIAIHKEHGYEHWKQIKYMIFDAPLVPDSFEERLATIQLELSKTEPENVVLIG